MPLGIEAKRRIRLMKQNEPVEEKKQEKEEIKSILEEIIREGARKMLQAAIEQEVIEYIASLAVGFTPHTLIYNSLTPSYTLISQ